MVKLGKIINRSDASEIAEAALVLPLVFMMILGVFWFGQAFSIYGTITHAAREGARAAGAAACATCAAGTPAQNAFNAIQNALLAAKLDPNKLPANPKTSPNNLVSCINGKAVTCAGIPSNVCVQESILLTSTTPAGAAVCGIAVSFQYPYQFWLPFTSLNQQKILLPAQSQMKMENQ